MSENNRTVGLLINPKAGYGIRMNRPGSDTVKNFSPEKSETVARAISFLRKFRDENLLFVTAGYYMGEFELKAAGISSYVNVYHPKKVSDREDTLNFVRAVNKENVGLLLFFGGDGTAYDISSVVRKDLPVLGIPSGVKMYSSVFAIDLEHAQDTFSRWLSERMEFTVADIVDADEEAIMEDRFSLNVRGALLIPASDNIVMGSKREYQHADVSGIVEYIIEKMEPNRSYFIGSGSTCKSILRQLGIITPFYGVDIIKGGKLIRSNADAKFLSRYSSRERTSLILSPIGGQGFLVGRGNRQIDDSILKNIRNEDIVIISSPEKIVDLKHLYIDSRIWKPSYVRVLYDYGRFRIVKVKR